MGKLMQRWSKAAKSPFEEVGQRALQRGSCSVAGAPAVTLPHEDSAFSADIFKAVAERWVGSVVPLFGSTQRATPRFSPIVAPAGCTPRRTPMGGAAAKKGSLVECGLDERLSAFVCALRTVVS